MTSCVVLRARFGRPLADARLRSMVTASAHALAERQGIVLRAVAAGDDRISITLEADRIVAMGFAAELRRTTERWHRAKTGATLWGETDADEETP